MRKTIFILMSLFVVNTVWAKENSPAPEFLLIVVDKNASTMSKKVEANFKDPTIIQRLKDNNQTFRIIYGQDYPKERAALNVKWYPTILKCKQQGKKWQVYERIIGGNKKENLLDFLGNRSIIKGLVKPIQRFVPPLQKLDGS